MKQYKATIDFWNDFDRNVAITIAMSNFNISPLEIKHKKKISSDYEYRLQIKFINKEQFLQFINTILQHNIDLVDIKIK